MMISKSDRISINNFSNTYPSGSAYTSMFMDDFYDIVPIYGSKYEKINSYLKPENKDFEKLLYDLLPSDQRRHSATFNDIVLETIKLIANHLTHKGYVIFEFVTSIDINDETIYKLNTVFSAELKLKKNNVIQVLHPNVAEQQSTKSISIPKSKCYIIEFPSVLGGKEKYLKFLEDFRMIENESPMMAFFRNPLNGQPGYDSAEHQRLNDLEFWRKSKQYGWHHRGDSNKMFSSYYYIYRHLNFKKTKIILRDYIIEQLNSIIRSISKQIADQQIELKIEGLIPINTINERLKDWENGKPFPENINEIL